MSTHIADPSTEDIDAILRFLPTVEAPDFSAGVWAEAQGETARHFAQSEQLESLVAALYGHHWIYDFDAGFDWSEWQPVAERYVKDPALLEDAGLGTMRKLFTTHVRRDNFDQGHLAAIVAQGHLKALLHRLLVLRRR